MKSYTIKNTGNSKVAATLAAQMQPGKAGELLVRSGFTQDNFAAFLADVALRCAAAGFDKAKLASAFKALAAGNASQARQACGDLVIIVDGGKEQSLNDFWGKTAGVAKPDLSILDGI